MKFKLEKAKLERQVTKLGKELEKNKGIVPEKWIPWIELIKAVLIFAKTFTGDKADAIIDKILAAIAAWEKKRQIGK